MKKLFFVALLSSLAIGSARADNPDLNAIIGVSNDVMGYYAFVPNNGDDAMLGYGLSSSDLNSFAVEYYSIDSGDSYGVLKGHGRCSSQVGDNQNQTWTNPTMFDSLTDETGQSGALYCYCQLDNYTPLNGSAQSLSGPWVFNYQDNSAYGCGVGCAEECSYGLSFTNESYLAFRSAIFNAYANSSSGSGGNAITTQTYVDNLLNTKQAKITTTGTNKLMTYGASTGATPGSRDIVSTLGTSTTATTVPEVGPIVAEINSKQDAVNGTADYVMTGTGTAGTVGEKPVYSATTNYSNALVTAQTINTATANAANSELTCVDNDCLLWQISATTPRAMSTIPGDPSINGTDNCYRRAKNTSSLGNQAYYNGTCSADTLSYLGTNYSYSGRWGVVLPYGDISGVSVCAGNGASRGTVATDVQSAALDAALASGQQPNTSHGCWCKMENPMPSRWVFYDDVGNYPWDKCAMQCAAAIKSNTFQMRTIMYNNPQ